MRIWVSVILLLVSSPALKATSELPVLGELATINIEREKVIGKTVYDRLLAFGLIETHPLLDRYINDLGYRLLAGIENRVRDYRFFIIRDDAVNAFALPGGYIGVNRGLIRQARTQHQLASVLAHEIAHVELMHGIDMMEKSEEVGNKAIFTLLAGLLLASVDSQLGSAVIFGGVAGSQQAMINYTRDNEYEADRVGIDLMQDAQFDPRGMVEFFRIMGELSGSSELGGIEYLRTHPISNNRVSEAASRVKNIRVSDDFAGDFLWFKDFLLYASTDHLQARGSDYLRALAYIQAGKYAQSDQLLRELYRQDSENIWYSIAFAENLELMGEEAQAELVYRRLLDIFPGDYILSMRLLRLLKLAGRNQSALVIARGIENRFPQDRQIYFELSEIYQSLQRPGLRLMAQAEYQRLNGNPGQAIRLYDEILRSGDVDSVTVSEAREKRSILLSNQAGTGS